MNDSSEPTVSDRFIGCLLGGAVGDALGAPIEFMTYRDIVRCFGPSGVCDYLPAYGGLGRITDDTQMTLFTADGLIRAAVREEHKGITTVEGVTAHAYLRWLLTQGERPNNDLVFGMEEPGWLYPLPALHARRAPGITCLSALKAMRHLGDPARNDSKGCGGVMRVAPVGLWMAGRTTEADSELCFKVACDIAGLTHGHPTGQLAAGVMAVLVQLLTSGASINTALRAAQHILGQHREHGETTAAVEQAVSLAAECADRPISDDAHARNIEKLGFKVACDIAGLTHGHPTGQLAAGVMAVLVQLLTSGASINTALRAAQHILGQHREHGETTAAVEQAVSLAAECADRPISDDAHARNIEKLGEGWIAEEALAIAIYCALVASDFEHGVRLSINHSGDSDSTGSMTGNLLGCVWGQAGIPVRWLADLELSDEIKTVAKGLRHCVSADWSEAVPPTIDSDETWKRYPGF